MELVTFIKEIEKIGFRKDAEAPNPTWERGLITVEFLSGRIYVTKGIWRNVGHLEAQYLFTEKTNQPVLENALKVIKRSI